MIFDELIKDLPSVLRVVEEWRAWLRVMAAPMQLVENDIGSYKNKIRYELQFNGQVVYLEHRLNDAFDAVQRRIYIDDPLPTNIQPNIVTNRAERQPTIVIRNRGEASPTVTFYNISELQTRWDFVVFVPSSVYAAYQINLRSIVNYYRVAGKVWTFQTI